MNKLRRQLAPYGEWALVAGASEGLGEAFARVLAGAGKNVILVARREDLLETLCRDLQEQYGVRCRYAVIDLAGDQAFRQILDETEREGCRLLVYNAAYGPVRRFTENTEEQLDYHIDLNARTLLKLTWAFAREHDPSEKAGILIMSSMAGLRGTMLVAPYAATKAFDFNLGEALHYELRERRIDVSVLCAGPIKTPNYLGTKPQYSWIKPKEHDPEFVAQEGLRLLGRKALGLPGSSNRFSDILLSRIMPRSWAVRLANDTMRKIYRHYME